MDYQTLIERLRSCRPETNCTNCRMLHHTETDNGIYTECLAKQAANSIEELSDWWNQFRALADMVMK